MNVKSRYYSDLKHRAGADPSIIDLMVISNCFINIVNYL